MESKRMALLGGRKTRSLPTQTFLPFPYYTIAVAGPGSDDHSQQENHFSVQEEESSLDCCKWESVECNPTTGRLTHLFLNLTAMNRLIGSIPQAFSNLKQIESLDLSHNNLSGAIPPQLLGLYMLSFFSVAYNNLSGSIPVMTAQFSTFEESSYVGNPFLCGKPLPKNCSTSGPSSLPKRSTDKGLIDMTAFYASFGSSRRRSISF
ncbi:hypothetical protein V6N11_013895 [Hibiscus sabdariffa]|uniref:Uncharacterized protein n=2 Tax=Hibiscus sabdariffa TaxID=183260 RepID=A0ABR1ZMU7_9ROSI